MWKFHRSFKKLIWKQNNAKATDIYSHQEPLRRLVRVLGSGARAFFPRVYSSSHLDVISAAARVNIYISAVRRSEGGGWQRDITRHQGDEGFIIKRCWDNCFSISEEILGPYLIL